MKKLLNLLELFLLNPTLFDNVSENKKNETSKLIANEREKILERLDEIDIEDEIPIIEATTFWDFPKQSYGLSAKGNNKHPGVTPAFIIYNMIWRYTDPGDLVVDPPCVVVVPR